MNEQTEIVHPVKIRVPVGMRQMMADAGIPPADQEKWARAGIWARVNNLLRQQERGETPSLVLAGMPEGMGDALAELVERCGFSSVSQLAEDLFRAALAAEGIALPGEGPRGEAPDGNGQADEVRSPTTGPPVLTLNQGRHTRRTFRHLLEDTDT